MSLVGNAIQIDLATNPLYERLLKERGFTSLNQDNLAHFLEQSGFGMLLFLEDPNRMKETMDALVIAPELAKTFDQIKNKGVLIPPDAKPVARKYGFRRWPAIVLLKDGQYLGAIDGLRQWGEYMVEIEQTLSNEPTRPPTIGIPVASV